MRLMPIVKSSLLATLGYNPDTEIVVAQFNSGPVYRYDGVPAGVFVSVITNSESQGKAFNEFIKGRDYAYEEISLEEAKGL